MNNSDEILNRMIQETLCGLSDKKGEEKVDAQILEEYFERQLDHHRGQETPSSTIKAQSRRHFYRFNTPLGMLDFPKSFHFFSEFGENNNLVVSIDQQNDEQNLFKILSIIWPNQSCFKFKMSPKNDLEIHLDSSVQMKTTSGISKLDKAGRIESRE